jgi:hypothetical protein
VKEETMNGIDDSKDAQHNAHCTRTTQEQEERRDEPDEAGFYHSKKRL